MEKLDANELTLSHKCMFIIFIIVNNGYHFYYADYVDYVVLMPLVILLFIILLTFYSAMLQEEETSSVTNPVKRPLIEEIRKATHRKCILFFPSFLSFSLSFFIIIHFINVCLATSAAPPVPQAVEEEDEKAIIWPDALFKVLFLKRLIIIMNE